MQKPARKAVFKFVDEMGFWLRRLSLGKMYMAGLMKGWLAGDPLWPVNAASLLQLFCGLWGTGLECSALWKCDCQGKEGFPSWWCMYLIILIYKHEWPKLLASSMVKVDKNPLGGKDKDIILIAAEGWWWLIHIPSRNRLRQFYPDGLGRPIKAV